MPKIHDPKIVKTGMAAHTCKAALRRPKKAIFLSARLQLCSQGYRARAQTSL